MTWPSPQILNGQPHLLEKDDLKPPSTIRHLHDDRQSDQRMQSSVATQQLALHELYTHLPNTTNTIRLSPRPKIHPLVPKIHELYTHLPNTTNTNSSHSRRRNGGHLSDTELMWCSSKLPKDDQYKQMNPRECTVTSKRILCRFNTFAQDLIRFLRVGLCASLTKAEDLTCKDAILLRIQLKMLYCYEYLMTAIKRSI